MKTLDNTFTRPIWVIAAMIFCFNGALFLWLLLPQPSQELKVAVDYLAQSLGPLIMVPFTFSSLRSAWKRDPVSRRLTFNRTVRWWIPTLLGLGLLCTTIGQCIWTYYLVFLHQEVPYPSIADVAYLCSYPFTLFGILLFPTYRVTSTTRSRFLLDGVVIMSAFFVAIWYFNLGPAILDSSTDPVGKIVNVAYPMADLVQVLYLVLLAFRSSAPAFLSALRILLLAMSISVIIDIVFNYQTLLGGYQAGELLDPAWPLVYMLTGLATFALGRAIVQQDSAARPQKIAEYTRPKADGMPTLWRMLMTYILVPAVGVLTLYTWQDSSRNLPLKMGVYAGGLLLIGVILLRQILAIRETLGYAHLLHRLNGQLSAMHDELHRKNDALEAVNTRLEALATTDPLTELPNHRTLLNALEHEFAHSQRYGHTFSLLFFDGDHFKHVNDTYGHSVGDAVLQELGSRVHSLLRSSDTFGRYGGEEFLVLLPETDMVGACEVAERMRQIVVATPLVQELVSGGVAITISIGVACFPLDGISPSEVLDKADQAMYWAKRLGRNQVRTAQDAERASHDEALASTIHNLDRIDNLTADGFTIEQAARAHQLNAIQSLLWLLDLRDHGNSEHAYAVSDLAAAIACELGLGKEEIFATSTAALLHDLGKIALPDYLLYKATPLSPTEWDLMRQHPALGAQILDVSPYLQLLIPAVAHHHENWDGTSYPDGLIGEEIPLAARIIRVAEAYHAMTTDRPYQHHRSEAWAQAELMRCSGSQFDPQVVAATLAVLQTKAQELITGNGTEIEGERQAKSLPEQHEARIEEHEPEQQAQKQEERV